MVNVRLVRTNPATGAKNLFLGSHVPEIEGMSLAAGRALIDEPTEAAIQPEHVYAHVWQPGDVVFWDNRCLLHAADRHRRYMRQTRASGMLVGGAGWLQKACRLGVTGGYQSLVRLDRPFRTMRNLLTFERTALNKRQPMTSYDAT